MIDIIIKNGHVIDPKNGVNGIKDIGIDNGRIVEIEDNESAKQIVNANNKFVFPGLIDAHAHMFYEGTEIGIPADIAYLPNGVTSAIDASAGVANYNLFRKDVVERSNVTIKAWLQVPSSGLVTTAHHENIDPKYFNPKKIKKIYNENSDNILGLKIRLGEELTLGMGAYPLEKTIEIAEDIGSPVEVHCTNIPVPSCEILSMLRPGDVFEHVYQGKKNTILDEDGKLYDCILKARKRGIIFDTGEGRKHCDYDVFLKALEQGFIADICSTDLVLASMYKRSIFSLPNLMSRYVAMGIDLEHVIKMTTENPAKLMKMEDEIGCLSINAFGDVAIFEWVDFEQTFSDWKGTEFKTDKLLKPLLTIKKGQIMYCAPEYNYQL